MARAPVACSLNGAELSARGDWLGALGRRASGIERRTDGLTVRFPADDRLESELHALARAESDCCPFLAIVVRRAEGDSLELDVSGPPEAAPVIDEMLASAGSPRP